MSLRDELVCYACMQVTVINKGRRIGDDEGFGRSMNKLKNFHFRVKDNAVDYFYPGSRT